MRITYATSHTWRKFIKTDVISQFGKNARAKIRSSLRELPSHDINVQLQRVDEPFLAWFIPFYEEHIYKKEHPAVVDIRGAVANPQRKYFALCLYENGVPLGATLFTLYARRLSIAFRMYQGSWITAPLQASPSLYMEYIVCLHALECGKDVLIHGKDRNPYGAHAGIGVAAFKLACGCRPRLSKTYALQTLDASTQTEESLIFAFPKSGKRTITKAYLFVRTENMHRWEQLTKYPHLLAVEVVLIN